MEIIICFVYRHCFAVMADPGTVVHQWTDVSTIHQFTGLFSWISEAPANQFHPRSLRYKAVRYTSDLKRIS